MLGDASGDGAVDVLVGPLRGPGEITVVAGPSGRSLWTRSLGPGGEAQLLFRVRSAHR